jgi:hypothetical protein
MRAAIERVRLRSIRKRDVGTTYDVEHSSYVAYSDFGTVDSATEDTLRPLLRRMPRLHVFRSGNLDPLLDALEEFTS